MCKLFEKLIYLRQWAAVMPVPGPNRPEPVLLYPRPLGKGDILLFPQFLSSAHHFRFNPPLRHQIGSPLNTPDALRGTQYAERLTIAACRRLYCSNLTPLPRQKGYISICLYTYLLVCNSQKILKYLCKYLNPRKSA
jgi:hypothetical protein